MKYILTGILLLLCMNAAFTQLRYKENGTARFADTCFMLKDSLASITVDSTALKTWQYKSVADFKKDLKNNIETTIEKLDDHSTPLSLTKWLLRADTTALKSTLQLIYDNVDNGNVLAVVPAHSGLRPLAEAINTALTAPHFKIERSAALRHLTYTLTREDLLSSFLTQYYSSTLSSSLNKQVARTTLSDYYNYYTELKPQYDTMKVLLQRIATEARPETIEQLYLSHLNFNAYVLKSKFISLLKSPFYSQWLWSTGATIKLNPLDFTASVVLDTVPSLDLLAKNFTKAEFLSRNKRLKEENALSMQTLLVPTRVVNQITFPVGATGNNQFFLLDAKEKNLEISNVRILDEKEKIYIQLLNIDKGYRARYKITDTKILSGQSPTEEIIDTASRGLLTLFNLLNPQAAAISGIVAALNKPNNEAPFIKNKIFTNGQGIRIPEQANFLAEFSIDRRAIPSIDSFWNATQGILEVLIPGIVSGDNSSYNFYDLDTVKRIRFNAQIYQKLKKKYAKEALDSVNTHLDKKIKAMQEKVIGDYLGQMYAQEVAPILIDSLRNDSFYVAQLINVISSSLPVSKIEPTTDTVPQYRSELLVIDDRTRNVEQTILVDKINNGAPKDSAGIVSFSYKKGRRTLVEVSFGLSYTFQHVWVQKVDQNKVTSKDERYRGVAALHFYPFKGKNKTRRGLHKIDEPFFGSRDRINIMVGAGIPKPLDNYYLGIGYDFGPGLKFNTGVHFHKYREYTMKNDVITGDEPEYKALFPFVSLSLNPQLVVTNIIAVFKTL